MSMTSLARKREETGKVLRSVLLSNKRGLLPSELEREYYEMSGSKLDYHSLGYPSIQSLMKNMKEFVAVEKLTSGHIIVTAAPDSRTEHIVSDMTGGQIRTSVGDHHKTRYSIDKSTATSKITLIPEVERTTEVSRVIYYDSTVPERIKENICAVLKEFPEGIHQSQLGVEYKKMFKEDLDPSKMGLTNVLEMCCLMSDLVDVKCLEEEEDWILALKPKKLSVEECLSNDKCCGDNVLRNVDIRWKIQELDCPIGGKVEVAVHYVKTSSVIFIQLKSMQCILRNLEVLLDRTLDENAEHFYTSRSDVKIGGTFAAKFESQWFRATVRSFKGLSYVKVFLLDYGSIQTVPFSNLRHLPRDLVELPAQAIPVRLSDVNLPDTTLFCDLLKHLVIEAHERDEYLWVQLDYTLEEDEHFVSLSDSQGNIINHSLVDRERFKAYQLSNKLKNIMKILCKKNYEVTDEVVNMLDVLVQKLEVLELDVNENCIKIEDISEVMKPNSDLDLHVIYFELKYWCISSEIAGLVKVWGKNDFLDQIIKMRSLNFQSRRLMKESHEILWEKLIHCGVVDYETNEVSLYLLQDVAKIVERFAAKDTYQLLTKDLNEILASVEHSPCVSSK